MQNPANTVLEVCMSYAVPRCLHVITDFGVADALGDTPRSAADLAASTGADPDSLGRALRLLAAYDIFQAADGGYAHTPASLLLRADHPQSLRSYVRFLGAPLYWQVFEKLSHSIATGNPALPQVIPEGQWEYFGKNPELSQLFDEAMAGKAHGQIAGIIAGYEFSPFKTIADIGGGQGHLLQAVLGTTSDLTGTLFDLPHVVQKVAAKAFPRLHLQGGDFFNDKLPTCDAYMIMQVLHDWPDQEATQILSAIRRSAPPHAKLLLIEAIVPEDPNPSWITMLDLFMLVLFGGKERTRPQFEALLSAAGFRLNRVIDIGLGTFILEASAV
jgi:hypothetical protein